MGSSCEGEGANSPAGCGTTLTGRWRLRRAGTSPESRSWAGSPAWIRARTTCRYRLRPKHTGFHFKHVACRKKKWVRTSHLIRRCWKCGQNVLSLLLDDVKVASSKLGTAFSVTVLTTGASRAGVIRCKPHAGATRTNQACWPAAGWDKQWRLQRGNWPSRSESWHREQKASFTAHPLLSPSPIRLTGKR